MLTARGADCREPDPPHGPADAELYLIAEQSPNAFATGRNPSHASVAFTEGILQLMTDQELEGVVAHELGTCCTATS